MDEIAGHVYGFARVDVRQLMQELAEDRAQLRSADMGAEAEVHPATAEAEMRVRASA